MTNAKKEQRTQAIDVDPAIELRATRIVLREHVARIAELEAALLAIREYPFEHDMRRISVAVQNMADIAGLALSRAALAKVQS